MFDQSPTKEDIKFFKGVIVHLITQQANKDGKQHNVSFTYDEIDSVIKYRAGLFDISCTNVSHEQMQELKEYGKEIAARIGIEIKDQDERSK